MRIQSLSVVIPTKRCVNNCPFCVSKMHDNDYVGEFFHDEIEKRIKWALSNGVNTCILTGTGEAFQNRNFLTAFVEVLKKMDHPLPNMELQTTGVFLIKSGKDISLKKNYNIELLKLLKVNTISLSIFDIWSDNNNMIMQGTPEHLHFKLKELIDLLKEERFNVRLSINMSSLYDQVTPTEIFTRIKKLGVHQVTFRKLYESGNNGLEDEWVKRNKCQEHTIDGIQSYIRTNGSKLPYVLPYGAAVYSIFGMSTVLDDDCMGKSHKEDVMKYVIIRENGKLYCQWDDEGSLIF